MNEGNPLKIKDIVLLLSFIVLSCTKLSNEPEVQDVSGKWVGEFSMLEIITFKFTMDLHSDSSYLFTTQNG